MEHRSVYCYHGNGRALQGSERTDMKEEPRSYGVTARGLEVARRLEYIRASDKRVAQWKDGSREAFEAAVRRMSGTITKRSV